MDVSGTKTHTIETIRALYRLTMQPIVAAMRNRPYGIAKYSPVRDFLVSPNVVNDDPTDTRVNAWLNLKIGEFVAVQKQQSTDIYRVDCDTIRIPKTVFFDAIGLKVGSSSRELFTGDYVYVRGATVVKTFDANHIITQTTKRFQGCRAGTFCDLRGRRLMFDL